MRIKSVHIVNFGKLHEMKMELSSGLNVVRGDNGWGKTTLAAFVKAMLYGLASTSKRALRENERRMYLPWQGGPFGGSMEFEAGGKAYRAERFFGAKDRDDRFVLYDLATGLVSGDYSERLGEELFHMDRGAYERSCFLGQLKLPVSVNDSLNARLTRVEEDAGDMRNYERAMESLESRMKFYRKTGNRGEIAALQEERRRIRERMAGCREREEEKAGLQRKLREAKTRADRLQERENALRDRERELREMKDESARQEQYQLLKRRAEEATERLRLANVELARFERAPLGEEELDRLRERLYELRAVRAQADEAGRQERLAEERCAAVSERAVHGRRDVVRGQEEPEVGRAAEPESAVSAERRDGVRARLAAPLICGVLAALLLAAALFLLMQSGSAGSAASQNVAASAGAAAAWSAAMTIASGAPPLLIAAACILIVSAFLLYGRAVKENREEAENEARRAEEERALGEQLRELREKRDRLERQAEALRTEIARALRGPEDADGESLETLWRQERRDSLDYGRLCRECALRREAARTSREEFLELSRSLPQPRTEQEQRESTILQEPPEPSPPPGQREPSSPPEQPQPELALLLTLDRLLEELRQTGRERQETAAEAVRLESRIAMLEEYTARIPELSEAEQEFSERIREAEREYALLERTAALLREARDRFLARYLQKLKEQTGYYANLLEPEMETLPELNVALKPRLLEAGALREMESFSAGWQDLLWLSERFALMDALGGEEEAPAILDDPFVNLDDRKRRRAMELLEKMGERRQILYFACR
ncbi:MAG: AAA family ATPase [Eubacteriales bacterium]|nr:AAA family ATPase [Eubacteriales bacterium]